MSTIYYIQAQHPPGVSSVKHNYTASRKADSRVMKANYNRGYEQNAAVAVSRVTNTQQLVFAFT